MQSPSECVLSKVTFIPLERLKSIYDDDAPNAKMMSHGPYGSRQDSFERIELTDRPKDDHWISPETPSENKVVRMPRFHRKPPHCLAVFSVLTDFLLLSGTILLEYFLRLTTILPYRKQRFSCADAVIKQSSNISLHSYETFFLNGKVPEEIVWIISFTVPPAVMLFFEVIVWSLTRHKTKEFRVGCGKVDLPQTVRRILRFIVVFVFGAFITLVIVDVSKMMVGRLRPIFLEVCNPKDLKRCSSGDNIWTDVICRESDPLKLKYARTSFPSLRTALTAYAAIYLSVYLHGVTHTHRKNITVPFFSLGLILCSLLCGYSLIGHNQCFWEDVVVGFMIGAVIAFYLSVYVQRSFDYHDLITNRKLYKKLQLILSLERARDFRETDERRGDKIPYFGDSNFSGSNPQLTHLPTFYGNGIPRPQILRQSPSHGHSRDTTEQQYNTFQRDLQRTIDQYRRTSPTDWSQHM